MAGDAHLGVWAWEVERAGFAWQPILRASNSFHHGSKQRETESPILSLGLCSLIVFLLDLQISLVLCFVLMFGNSMLLTSYYASSLVIIWVSIPLAAF